MKLQKEELVHKELKVVKPVKTEYNHILTDDALKFLYQLASTFSEEISERLEERRQIQKQIDDGNLPNFLSETSTIRGGDWTIGDLPDDLKDRKVEITGPVDRKMIINGLNSGANVFMADFEDSNSPTWSNIIQGQINLYDAVRRTIRYSKPDGSKDYELKDNTAVLMVRPRGLHMVEEGILFEDNPIPASLVDFGLFFFHNAKELIDSGSGPYFYIPKLQNYKEARLWNEIFDTSQNYLNIPSGTIKATVLLEHILAAFQMDEILYELRNHSAGLNCGRWDYIFSYIKTFGRNPDYILPDRNQITMNRHFLHSYVKLLIQTCHKRRAHAMGGMAAQIPIKNDQKKNQKALQKVRDDKIREVKAGHDGTWVAHPGLIQIARQAFDEWLDNANQFNIIPEGEITPQDLLKVPEGTITEQGIMTNIRVSLLYLSAWLEGNGCVPISNLMEDAATAEISRTQLWQWVYHRVELESGKEVTPDYFLDKLNHVSDTVKQEIGEEIYQNGRYKDAKRILRDLTLDPQLVEFLTVASKEELEKEEIL